MPLLPHLLLHGVDNAGRLDGLAVVLPVHGGDLRRRRVETDEKGRKSERGMCEDQNRARAAALLLLLLPLRSPSRPVPPFSTHPCLTAA